MLTLARSYSNYYYLVGIVIGFLLQGTAMAENIFLYSKNSTSKRFAILEETEKVAFLYLTQKDLQVPERDVIAYMRVKPSKNVAWEEFAKSGMPPLLSAELATPDAIIKKSEKKQFSFHWSEDGQSVALIHNGIPIAFVSITEKLGFSKAVAKENGLSRPWNQNLFETLFVLEVGEHQKARGN